LSSKTTLLLTGLGGDGGGGGGVIPPGKVTFWLPRCEWYAQVLEEPYAHIIVVGPLEEMACRSTG